MLVYYWYQSGRQVYADLFRMKLSLLSRKIRQWNEFDEGNAFVRISTSELKEPEKATSRLQKYGSSLFYELPRLFANEL